MEFNDICPALIDLYHGKVYVTNDSILTLTWQNIDKATKSTYSMYLFSLYLFKRDNAH